jgi:DNA-binding NtrC family response regulator
MKRIRDIIGNVAPSDSTVLIQGKSGTGKELVARAIHDLSFRADGPFQAVNCGVFTETLIENELFGHEKGAFTGAVQRAIGRIEAASGGTLFLDEIDTMPLSLQVKLLRVLEEHTFHRVGGTKPIYADFRLIAATNVNLQEAVARKLFRDDLYYRLNVITITLPELRERASDVPLLVKFFIDRFKGRSKAQSLSASAMDLLMSYSWPGNVRELANAIEYAMVMAQGLRIMPTDLPESIQTGLSASEPQQASQHMKEGLSLNDTERELIIRTLKECGGNKNLTAKTLKIPRSTLYSKLQKHGIIVDEKPGDVLTEETPDVPDRKVAAVQNQT